MRIAFLSIVYLFISFLHAQKINGVCLVSPPQKTGIEKMAEVKRMHANWVAVIPYAFSREGQPGVTFDHERHWWGERTEGTCELIRQAQSNGLKVMLKPHVWVMGQGWAGDFDLQNEADWLRWEKEYAAYIVHHAGLADSLKVDVFCIGTEFRIPARERPEFWEQLIEEVREVYSGKITYASNWDNYQTISWWSKLDYIGVDAYFPLVESMDPSTQEIIEGWEAMKVELYAFHQKWQLPILFTEYGFQSADGACSEHWEVDKSADKVNYGLQARAFDATFQCFMKEEWYAGGFVWKWHLYTWNERRQETEWTPENKPAEQVIAEWYSKTE